MDLRGKLTRDQEEHAASVLNYQPFIISDDLQTGAAPSWILGGDPRVRPTLLFRRSEHDEESWAKLSEANGRLRSLYDDLLDELAARFPGASLLDVACNNGYFPVGAELRGMRGTGIDMVPYGPSIEFLNETLGTRAHFLHARYDSAAHTLPPTQEHFDVVVASAIMCHLPDPMHFLAAIGNAAQKAVLFWGQVVNSENMLVAYKPSHPALSELTGFPLSFNDNSRLSLGMFKEAFRQMGFREVVVIEPKETWTPVYMGISVEQGKAQSLEDEIGIRGGSPHMAILAIR